MKIWRNIYLPARFFLLLGVVVFISIIAYIFPFLYGGLIACLILFCLAVIFDLFLLFRKGQLIEARREVQDKWSNGEENPVSLFLQNKGKKTVYLRVIDEVPVLLQRRDIQFGISLNGEEQKELTYTLHPVRRGVYGFGKLRVFVRTFLALIERRYSFDLETETAVYPSFMMMRRYELFALGNLHSETDALLTRIPGGNMAFEHIKPYVIGDDPRTVNWKATAKCNRLMVNEYVEERAQQIYCIADTGRTMQSPFDGMTMLDHVINTVLTLSNIILKKGDRAGLVTFSNTSGLFIKADNRSGQLNKISEALYRLDTDYQECDFDKLYGMVKRGIPTRSLLLLFTNFDTVAGMHRHLPALKRLSERHLLLVVLFENAELNRGIEEPVKTLKEIYFETIASGFKMEKYQMALELSKAGVHVILSRPEQLTANTINSYLALKRKQ